MDMVTLGHGTQDAQQGVTNAFQGVDHTPEIRPRDIRNHVVACVRPEDTQSIPT